MGVGIVASAVLDQFSPVMLPNLLYWLDASKTSSIDLVGTEVVTQRDLSGNGYVFFAPSPPDRPEYTDQINGLNVMTFDENRIASMTNLPCLQPRLYVFVMQPEPGGTGVDRTMFSTAGTLVIRILANDAFLVGAGGSTGDIIIDVYGLHVWTVYFNGSASQIWRDGISLWAGDPGSATPEAANNIGSDSFGGRRFNGYIPEIAVYHPTSLIDTDREALESYMLGRWLGGPFLPNAPILSTAIPSNAQVALNWEPHGHGGSSITDYIIEKSPNGTTGWTTVTETLSSASEYTVTGLTNGVIQYFRVAAVNIVGTGPYSNVLSATPFLLIAPYIVAITEAGGGVSSISKPAGGGIGDYYVISAIGQDMSSSPPALACSGFTLAGSPQGVSFPGGYWWHQTLYRSYDGSEGSSFSVSGLGGWNYIYCYLLRGAVVPPQTSALGTITGTAALVVPGVTVFVDDSLAVVHTVDYDAGTHGTPAGWTQEDVGPFSGTFLYSEEFDAGATGNITFTRTQDDRASGYMTVWPRPFSGPDDMPNLAAWFDAADPSSFTYSSGTLVSQWNDKSGTGKNLIQSTVSQQPSRSGILNSNSTVVFDGSNDFMLSGAYTGSSQPVTVIIVFKTTGAGKYMWNSRGTDLSMWQDGTTYSFWTGEVDSVGGGSSTDWRKVVTVFNGGSSKVRVGGSETAMSFGSGGFGQPLELGTINGNTGFCFNGQIAEFIVYTRALTAGEITIVETYLSTKWGV